MICERSMPSNNVLGDLHSWLSGQENETKYYACFAGAKSEQAHDHYDDIDLMMNTDAMTTWHDKEGVDDIAFFFNSVVPLDHEKIVVVESRSEFQTVLVNELIKTASDG